MNLLLVVRVSRSTNQGSSENIRIGVRAVGVTAAEKLTDARNIKTKD